METIYVTLALLIVVLLPILDRGKVRALRHGLPGSTRLAVYKRGVLTLWMAAAAACAAAYPAAACPAGQGWQLFLARPPVVAAWVSDHCLLVGTAVLAICVFFLVATVQGLACARDAARRRRIAPAFARLRFMLPVSRQERRWWVLLSVSAGIGEELLYRGFLLHFLLGEWPSGFQPGVPQALLSSALAFALAHLYQGWRGMLSATAMGLVFGLLAVGTGSLVLPIVLHIVIDLQVLWMYRPDLDGDPAAADSTSTKNFFA